MRSTSSIPLSHRVLMVQEECRLVDRGTVPAHQTRIRRPPPPSSLVRLMVHQHHLLPARTPRHRSMTEQEVQHLLPTLLPLLPSISLLLRHTLLRARLTTLRHHQRTRQPRLNTARLPLGSAQLRQLATHPPARRTAQPHQNVSMTSCLPSLLILMNSFLFRLSK
jgi:hypothetical protein